MDKILTTHAGSLIRPAEVLEFLDGIDRGEQIDHEAFAAAMTQAVADIVREQADVGIDIVSDGEIGKVSWISYLYERISGLEVKELPPGSLVMPPSRDRLAFPEFYEEDDKAFCRADSAGDVPRRERACPGELATLGAGDVDVHGADRVRRVGRAPA